MKEELKNLFSNYLSEKTSNVDEVIWDEEPITFKEFICSPEHMNFPPYSDRQMDVMDFMFGDDPKKIFENEHSLAVLALGKGSGKDTMAVHATDYVVYVLLCCHNPLSLFKGVTADYLDILNVAYNHRQAVDIFMAKLILSIKNWKWLRNKYKLVDSNEKTLILNSAFRKKSI